MFRKMLSMLLAAIMVMSLALPVLAVAEEKDPVTIVFSWWGGDARHEATIAATEAFMQKYPWITVETQYGAFTGWEEKVSTQIAGKSTADVMQMNWNWYYTFSPEGEEFYDLNDYAEIIDLTQFPQALLDGMTIGGHLQGIPISASGLVFWWNKATFDKAGIAVPESFEDILAAGPIFQEKLGDDYYPMVLNCYNAMNLMVYYLEQKYQKAWVVDGVVNYTVEEVADGIAFIRSLEDNHVIPSQKKLAGDGADSTDKNPNLIDGHYGGFYEFDTSTLYVNAVDENQELVIGAYPRIGEETSAFNKISMAYGISKNTEHPEECAMLIDFLLNDEEGIRIQGNQRGTPASAKAQSILEAEGVLSGILYEANKAMSENSNGKFPLDPYYENSALRDTSEGLYYEVFEALSYDNEDPTVLAEQLIDGINEVEAKMSK